MPISSHKKYKLDFCLTVGVVLVVSGKLNGEEKKELVDSGNETGAGEGETEEENEIYYDKTKSFFDNISCEAIERSKGYVVMDNGQLLKIEIQYS